MRAGARTLEVEDLEGAGECPAIRFGERGRVAREERDAPVSQELRAAVLARDGRCLACGSTEDLTVRHFDSHADGGKSDPRRLGTLCRECQGAVHEGEITLGIEEDGRVTASDREGNIVGGTQSAAAILAECGEASRLETIVRRAAPARGEAPAPRESAATAPEARSELEGTAALSSPDLRTLEDLPRELSASEWRALEGRIEWSPSHRAFLLRDPAELLEPLEEAPRAREERPLEAGTAASLPHSVLGPGGFGDFAGQRRLVDNLRLALWAARGRGEPLGHVLRPGE